MKLAVKVGKCVECGSIYDESMIGQSCKCKSSQYAGSTQTPIKSHELRVQEVD